MKTSSDPASDSAQYRDLLLEKRAELLAEIGSNIPRFTDAGQLSDDDQAQALHEQFVSVKVRQRCYRTLQEVNAALDRLDTGDYGVCLDCGERIHPRRLLAIPWAAYCVQCQERRGHGVEEFDERAA